MGATSAIGQAQAVQVAGIKAAIAQAAAQTGESFDYLVRTAARESSFRPDIQNANSSATGLFQFIESTWMKMVKNFGEKYGLSDLAAKIDDSGGTPKVTDAAARRQILDLRKDPAISSLMAAELANENRDFLEGSLGRNVNNADLYMAHFLGSAGAAKFLAAKDRNGTQSAAALFPAAAAANPTVFFDQGRARSLDQVYARMAKSFDGSAPAMPSATSWPQARMASVNVSDAMPVDDLPVTLRNSIGLSAPGLPTGVGRGMMLSPVTLAALAALDAPLTPKNGEKTATS